METNISTNIFDMKEPMSFTVRNDYAFRRIFGREENKDILSEFVCLITGLNEEDFEEFILENSDLQTKHYDSKAGRLDIKIRLKSGEKIDIEMQNLWFSSFTKRSIFYWAEMFTEDFKRGEDYFNLNRCIAINIVNEPFNLTNKLHSIFKIMEIEDRQVLDEALEIHFLDLTKIPVDRKSVLENWLLFIQTDKQEVRDMMAETNVNLKKANIQMKEFYSVDALRTMYIQARDAECDRVSMLGASKREGLALGIQEGIEQGLAQGIERGLLQTALNMKQENFGNDVIAKVTGLPLKEIEKL